MKKFDDLCQQPGGGKKWLATYNKVGKTGNMDLIREFAPEVADRTSLAGVQQGLRNNSINQLKKLAITKPDLFREVAYQSMHSNFAKIYFPSTTGGMLGEEASNVADDWLSGDDSEN
jgi:hypothetical protein